MKREILINASEKESRVAILEDEVLVELLVDRPSEPKHLGDIYKGVVTAVLPGMQAAFVDIGIGKSGFLHVSDVTEEIRESEFDDNHDVRAPLRHRALGRKQFNIEDQLKKGQEVLVQIAKEPIGTKGARLTTQLSLPGRFLVYMPYMSRIGVSRKIEDPEERRRLRRLIASIKPKEGGIIVRTVGEEVSKKNFERELYSLRRSWKRIKKKAMASNAPSLVHKEAKLTSSIIRDLFSDRVDSLIVDSESEYREIRNYLKDVAHDLLKRINLYRDSIPLFDAYGIEDEIADIFNPVVSLDSGGYIVVEPTEALVSIDVNTGKYTGKKDPEETILRTNLDAAKEIARQIRLRNIGGIIVCDFIDMENEDNKSKVIAEFRRNLARDRAKTKAYEITELGLIEVTRQRMSSGLFQVLSDPCPACEGKGRVLSSETMARKIERAVKRVGALRGEKALEVRAHPRVVLYIMEEERETLSQIEKEYKLTVTFRDDPLLKVDEFKLMSIPSKREIALG
ncbi:MAG: ribonuclease E/G [Candidatus Glassbacteria bacterium]